MNNSGISGNWSGQDNMFAGQWINKNTGEKITVNNSLIDENNQMILITSIGQMTMDELGDYIQIGEEEEAPMVSMKQTNVKSSTTSAKQNTQMPTEVIDDYLLPEDKALLNGIPHKDILDAPHVTTSPSIPQTKQETKHKDILDKFFGNEESTTLKVNMNFNFDIDELKTLMKYIDLNLDDICEYIYENVVNKDAVKKQIKETIYNYLENSI